MDNNGIVYGLNERDLQAVNARTGEEIWEGERYGYGQLIRRGKHLIVLNEEGQLILVDSISGKELAQIEALRGKTWSNPALADNLLFIRNNQEAVCYELKIKENN